MKDRVSIYPGRVKLVPVAGQENTYDMVRADSPTKEGTPLNKDSLLKDATAALFGLGTDAVPDEVFALLKTLVDDAKTSADAKLRIENVEYVGTGTSGESGNTSLIVPIWTKFVIISGVTNSGYGRGIGIFAKPKKDSTNYAALGIGTRSTGNQYIYGYHVKWVGTELLWFMVGSGGSSNAYDQLNSSDSIYTAYCIG